MTRITDEYRKLQPLIVSEIRAALQGLSLGASGGGGAAPDLTGYLTQTAADARYLKLAGGTMTGNIGMPALGTVDSVDLSVHVLDPDAHHARQHGILTAADHSMIGSALDLVGLTATDTLGKLTPSSNPGAASAILRTDSSGVLRLTKFEVGSTPAFTLYGTNNVSTNPDIDADTSFEISVANSFYQNIDSGDAFTTQAFIWAANRRINSGGTELMRLTETGRLGIGDSTPSYELDVAGTIQGQTAVRSPAIVATTDVATPLIVTASGNLTLTPASTSVILSDGKAYTSVSFAGGFTGNGFRIDQGIATTGKTTAEFDNLVVRGRMSVYELLIRQIRATNGAVFVTSTAKVTGVSGPSAGIYTLTTDDETPHGFLVNDVIRAQRTKWDGSTLVGIYQSDMIVTGSVNLYTFRATLETGSDAPEVGYEYVRLGNTGNADRRGTVYLTADDTNAPYIDIVDGVTSHADWNTAGKIKGRFGKLTGVTSVTNEYGLIVGNGFAATDKYIKASTEGVLLNNVDMKLRSGSTQTGNIANDGTFWFGPSSGDKRIEWNGTTLNITGSGTFSGTITASGGTIGGWSITSNMIQSSNELVRMVHGAAGVGRFEVRNNNVGDVTTKLSGIMSRSSTSGVVFFAGATGDYTDAPNAPFAVTMAGALTATNATLTGSLTAGNVSINSANAITISVGTTYAANASINFTNSGAFAAGIGCYSPSSGQGILYMSGATSIYFASDATFVYGDDLSTAGNITAGKFVASGTTGYLRASTTDVLSWTATALTSAVDVTAPALRVASGTGYLKVGSTNVASWTSTNFNALDKMGTAWTELEVRTATFTGTVTGNVYVKQFGDFIIMKGWIRSTGATGDVIAFQNLPAFMCAGTGAYWYWAQRLNNSKIKFEIEGSSRTLQFFSYTTSQEVYFDQVMYSVG